MKLENEPENLRKRFGKKVTLYYSQIPARILPGTRLFENWLLKSGIMKKGFFRQRTDPGFVGTTGP